MFCAGYNPYFSVMLSLLNSDNFSVRAFSYSCILCLFLQHFYGLFYRLIFRDISLKSQELSALFFRHIFNGFILFNLFRWIISFSHPFISLIIRLFIRYYSFIYSYISLFLFRYFCFLSFKLFSCSYLFIYFLIHVFVKLC